MKLEQSKLLPDFQIGYFNQSLTGFQNVNGQEQFFNRADRFSGYTAGISFPLWFVPQKSRIEKSKIQKEAVEQAFISKQLNLKLQYSGILNDVMISDKELDYLESTAIPVSIKAVENAELAWKNGEIGYLELIQAIEQQQLSQNLWFDAITKFTHAVLQLNYLQSQ